MITYYMRLKHLQLQGFKTFATKTEFLFPSGITAIVGPNGSGKSNVADAIRWVLGEQSYSTLRAKRTEDMIFSGSQSRSRAGMAEATLTLDNDDGWLPVDFSEVTIGRRAYRDGQNEYSINGSRVRLRDVLELLSQSGMGRRTYMIVGQGLVDAVLSLRASERRELFEEAAGIAHYRDKRADALRRLEETQRNLDRVQDIIAEIEPRLKRLERQAERADEHAELSNHLQKLLRTWYGYRWHRATGSLDKAQQIVRHRTKKHEQRVQELEKLADRIDEIRKDQNTLRRQLGDWHRQSGALHTQAEKAQRELAVLMERKRQLLTQREEQLSEISRLEARLTAQSERIASARDSLETANTKLGEREKEAEAAQRALDARLAEREDVLQQRQNTQEHQAKIRTRITENESRQKELADRVATLAEQIEGNQDAISRLRVELSTRQADGRHIESELERVTTEMEQARTTHEATDQQRQTIARQLEQQDSDLQKLREREAQLVARFELLGRLRRDFAIYDEAARTLLKADLPGVHGVLAQLVQIPQERQRELSTAVEAALGAYTSSIVVDNWQAAANVLRYLQSTDVTGRVILSAIKSPFEEHGGILQSTTAHQKDTGYTPLSTQIECDHKYRSLVERLLGQAYLVPNLLKAQTLLPSLGKGAFCVTPEGEVLHRDGMIEGGRVAEQTSPLVQEQEWSHLNKERVKVGAKRETVESKVASTRQLLEQLQDRLVQSNLYLDELQARSIDFRTSHEQISRQIDRLQQEIEWRETQLEQTKVDRAALEARQAEIAGEFEGLEQMLETLTIAIQQANEQLEELSTKTLSKSVTAAQMAVATARQNREGQTAVLNELEAVLDQMKSEHQARERRTKELTGQEQNVTRRITQLAADQADLTSRLETLSAQIEPAEESLAELEQEIERIERSERRETTSLREFENHLTSARLDVQRREDELERLRSRIEDDLGLVELEFSSSLAAQTPLPLHPIVSPLPSVQKLPEGLEDEVKRLRTRIRRLGSINPGAPADYQELLERYTFLKEQSNDLVEAGDSLRQIINEMDGLIEHHFSQTFKAVAVEFKETFTSLFGGGKAELKLTEPNDLTQAGVEIVAQPPGKRLQALASLSGGERSLTAVALIFSILRISPTPFCILDEVDAMLDEANIGRFRQMLENLSNSTQIVIITHNRGTITAADTIYGISMGADSASQAVSLRMEGEKIATQD